MAQAPGFGVPDANAAAGGAAPVLVPHGGGPAVQDALPGDQNAHLVAIPVLAAAPNPILEDGQLPEGMNVAPLVPPHNPPVPAIQDAAVAAHVAPAGAAQVAPIPAAAAPVVPAAVVGAPAAGAPGAPAALAAAPGAAPAPIDVADVQTAADAQNINPSLSGKDILKDLIDKLKGQGEVVLSSKLQTNPDGSYVFEPFTDPDEPGATFYKTKAIYTATVRDNTGQIVKDVNGKDLVVSVTRDIYTNGRTPEHAGIIASNVKNTIVASAQSESGMDSRLFTKAQYQALSASQKSSLASQRTFRLSFKTDANTGKITKLDQIIVGSKTGFVSMTLAAKKGRYVQHIQDDEQKKAKLVGGQIQGPAGGRVVFKTKEEALQNARYTVKHSNIFDSLKTGLITFDALKEELEKKEKELSSLKDSFKAAGFLGLWKSKARDPALTQFLELSKVQKLLQHSQALPATMSTEVKKYVDAYDALEDLRADYGSPQEVQAALDLMAKLTADNNAIMNLDEVVLLNKIKAQEGAPTHVGDVKKDTEALYDFVNKYSNDINTLEQEMHQIESTINADAAKYNHGMMEFQKKNQEYENLYNQYKALKMAAKTPANQQSPDDIAIGKKIKSEIPKDFLKKMKAEIKANHDMIEEFRKELRVDVALGGAENIANLPK